MKDHISQDTLRCRKALWAEYQRPCPLLPSLKGSSSIHRTDTKHSKMLAARFLRRALPVLRQARSYAEAVSGAPQMSFTFASPTKVFFNSASVKQVDVPTLTGAFGILPAHVPTLQVLRPGVVTVFNDDGSAAKYFVSSGSVTVNADSSVQLLAEEAFPLDQLDAAMAKANLEKAQAVLMATSDEAARAEVQISIDANEAIVKALE
ncbi:ATP synthase subunit delta, mitochondrial [Eucyclogobius newberryi]|uniref:ATP synthase subunit delta, mitochondrial n=1 Tax=Eucyclogobius newberryi TaxID=166745 RepID=UPI003B58C7A7